VIGKLAHGEEVVITDNQQPVAKLVGERPARPPRPAPGAGKGPILYMAPDFDEPMEEFKEYTQCSFCSTPLRSCGLLKEVRS
jgi:antitoxin (DNA-binding transcriptional repressor) of toxin-antitoxin stability system